ncbi:16S rRNA (guanine(966)-N(2))-methyltransferase RsmD [bacterium]|nr:16S rRNA (guanine(966)-N(2))-methyltransferase RsmD [Chloroflexi bacterium CFX6]RIL10410.1 MAG: 16S rRNA (guanine(966)-N(2))-methyltransferase RsmD [bacterium]
MRVIAGKARGRRLQAVPGQGTRPITDRAKEALFSILGVDVNDAWVLDLFAGTGGVGIEALSRGAAGCDFVEQAPAAVRTIHQNLEHTGLAGDTARVLRRDVFQLLREPPREPYHIVFVAPPQYKGLWLATLRALDAVPEWVTDDGVIVVQIDPVEDAPVTLEHFHEIDRRTYSNVRLLFFVPAEVDGQDDDADDAAPEAPIGLDDLPVDGDGVAWLGEMYLTRPSGLPGDRPLDGPGEHAAPDERAAPPDTAFPPPFVPPRVPNGKPRAADAGPTP